MKTIVHLNDFRRAFSDCGRENQFTYEGLEILFNWIEQMDSDTGEETELDVIALCCEFEEMHWEDVAANYEIDLTECETDEEKIDLIRDYVNDRAIYCGMTDDGLMIYSQF
jgi:hypothetical protein